ncbi:decarboxylase [Colletotrichum tofieldiae]|nr:decarboxylase [Colletotrichum tofieldiae]
MLDLVCVGDLLGYHEIYIIRKRKFLSDIPVDDILMLVLIRKPQWIYLLTCSVGQFIYTAAITALYLYFDIVAETDFESITPNRVSQSAAN